jgi:hypothetical protein
MQLNSKWKRNLRVGKRYASFLAVISGLSGILKTMICDVGSPFASITPQKDDLS